MSDSLELFAALLGGKHNLPPKLATPKPLATATAAEPASNKPSPCNAVEMSQVRLLDAFGNLQQIDSFIAENPVPASSKYDKRKTQPASPTSSQAMGAETGSDEFKTDLRAGEESPVGMAFCPFGAVAKFPYKFVAPVFMQPLASAFFDCNQIYQRDWDFFYAWHNGKVIPFVPQTQVQALLDLINEAFPIAWQFEPSNEDEGLLLHFDDPNPDFRPRFLGHANTRDQYNFCIANAPDEPRIDKSYSPEDCSLETFSAKMGLAVDAGKAKSKAQRQKRHGENIVKRQEMTKQVVRAQRYLGLSVKNGESSIMPDIAGLSLSSIEVNKPVPHAFDLDVIFISIDVEAWERSQGTITEVGVATLDTRDLHGKPPGENGKDWQQFIRARHFRVDEHKHYVNHEFVHGCPEHFDFKANSPAGGSEVISLSRMASTLTSCFHEPFSKSLAPTPETAEEATQKRNLILLGHDTKSDIAYCHSLGFSVLNRGNLLEALDTAAMFRSYTRDTDPRPLGHVINTFDFTGWNLHNAGNDAVYTMWAMLAICVRDAADRGSEDEESRRRKMEELQAKSLLAAAEKKPADFKKVWDRADSEDGGAAVPPEEDPPKRRVLGCEVKSSGFYTIGGAVLDV